MSFTTPIIGVLYIINNNNNREDVLFSSFPSNVTLEDYLFEENFALTFGGGLYVAFDGHLDHMVVLNRITHLKYSSSLFLQVHFDMLDILPPVVYPNNEVHVHWPNKNYI